MIIICTVGTQKGNVGVTLGFKVYGEFMVRAVKSTSRVQKSPFTGTMRGDVFTVTNDGGKLECAVEFAHLL